MKDKDWLLGELDKEIARVGGLQGQLMKKRCKTLENIKDFVIKLSDGFKIKEGEDGLQKALVEQLLLQHTDVTGVIVVMDVEKEYFNALVNNVMTVTQDRWFKKIKKRRSRNEGADR